MGKVLSGSLPMTAEKVGRSDWQAKWLCHSTNEAQQSGEISHEVRSWKCKNLCLEKNDTRQQLMGSCLETRSAEMNLGSWWTTSTLGAKKTTASWAALRKVLSAGEWGWSFPSIQSWWASSGELGPVLGFPRQTCLVSPGETWIYWHESSEGSQRW